jgi:hypothetical protein
MNPLSPYNIIISRINPPFTDETQGNITVASQGNLVFNANTLEKGWANNQHKISCIYASTYRAIYSVMELDNGIEVKHYELQNVTGRSGIFLHGANFVSQLLGCIALGVRNGYALIQSTATWEAFEKLFEYKDANGVVQHYDITVTIVDLSGITDEPTKSTL